MAAINSSWRFRQHFPLLKFLLERICFWVGFVCRLVLKNTLKLHVAALTSVSGTFSEKWYERFLAFDPNFRSSPIFLFKTPLLRTLQRCCPLQYRRKFIYNNRIYCIQVWLHCEQVSSLRAKAPITSVSGEILSVQFFVLVWQRLNQGPVVLKWMLHLSATMSCVTTIVNNCVWALGGVTFLMSLLFCKSFFSAWA